MSNENLLFKLDKYNNMFITEKKILNSSNNTITTYLYILNGLYEFILENDNLYELTDITKEFVLNFINRDTNAANSTKILNLAVIKAYLTYIDEKEDNNGLFENRLKKTTIKKESVEVDALDDAEVKKLLSLFHKKMKSFNMNRDSLLIKLILFTGIRASECLNIQLNDFSQVEEGSIYKIKIFGKGSKERFVYISKDKIDFELEFLQDYTVNYKCYLK